MRLINIIKYLFIVFIILIGSLEVGCYVLSKFKVLPFNDYPLVYLKSGQSVGLDWRSEKSEWGAWHKPNKLDSQNTSCINAKYESNNIGARDDPFDLLKGGDYILLGDSFAEGYGVNKTDSSEYLIETALNKKILNFGSAGNFGPLQYYLIYNQLASKYPHSGLLVFFLPANDFIDNDYRFWRGRDTVDAEGHKRYRPYWHLENENFTWFYPVKSVKTDCYNCPPPSFRTLIIKYTWMGNLYRSLESKYQFTHVEGERPSDEVPYPPTYSGYFDAQEIQQQAALFFLEKLISESKGRKVTLVVIPDKNDFIRINKGQTYKSQYWYKKLVEISLKRNNFSFIDLAEIPTVDYNNLFFECDGHWSNNGNAWAAEAISEHLKKQTN